MEPVNPGTQPLLPDETTKEGVASRVGKAVSDAAEVGAEVAVEGAGDVACCLAEAALDVGPECFVATAAVGGPSDHPDLDALRALRDRILLRSRPGRVLVRGYYRWGPYAARAIKGRPLPRAAVRWLLVHPGAALSRLLLRGD